MKKLLAIIVLASAFAFISINLHAKDNEKTLNVKWSENYTSLIIEYSDKEYVAPEDMLDENFPAPGQPPVYEFDVEWPYVVMSARWSLSMEDWPAAYRKDALDLVLMFASDAEIYEHIYPEQIKSSRFTFPPQYVEEADEILDGEFQEKSLIELMRGKFAEYEVVIKGGLGASDIKIKARIHVGSCRDGKTVFFHDEPQYISDYLSDRDFVFIAHDTGDRIEFEAMMACICAPRGLFKDVVLERIKKAHQYFIDCSYRLFETPPTEEYIKDYLELIRGGYANTGEMAKKHLSSV